MSSNIESIAGENWVQYVATSEGRLSLYRAIMECKKLKKTSKTIGSLVMEFNRYKLAVYERHMTNK